MMAFSAQASSKGLGLGACVTNNYDTLTMQYGKTASVQRHDGFLMRKNAPTLGETQQFKSFQVANHEHHVLTESFEMG